MSVVVARRHDTRESGSDGARALQVGGIVHVGVAVSRSRITCFWSRPSRDSSFRSHCIGISKIVCGLTCRFSGPLKKTSLQRRVLKSSDYFKFLKKFSESPNRISMLLPKTELTLC